MRYRLKLIITISLLVAVSLGLGGTLMISTSFHTMRQQEINSSLKSFENIQNTLYLLNSLGKQSDMKSLTDALSKMETGNLTSWQALSLKSQKAGLYHSGSTAMLQYEISEPRENQCSYVSVNDQFGHGFLVKSHIATAEGALVLTARFDISNAYHIRQTQQKQYLIIYVSVMLVGIVLAVVRSYTLTRHLRKLTGTVRKISGGDLSVRSRIASDDEFGQLARDFDVMADKLQDNIQKLETQMQQQESFMGAFAHELKTPMTSIIGYADLLRQGNVDENTGMTAASYIYSEGRRLERLSFKLLDLLLLQKDAVCMRPVRLSSFLGSIEQAMAPVLKSKGIRLICKGEPQYADMEPDLIKSLLYNLIDNASKAITDGGVIAVKASAVEGGCVFQVADTGRGMEQAELSRITEAFYRVDKARSRSQGGAGLGLALCEQIVRVHNGSLHFASQPGKGTRVTVTLYGKAGDGCEEN